MSERSELYARWKEADNAVRKLISGAQSATFSDGTGTRSYTKSSLSDLKSERAALAQAIRKLDRRSRPDIIHVGVRFDG